MTLFNVKMAIHFSNNIFYDIGETSVANLEKTTKSSLYHSFKHLVSPPSFHQVILSGLFIREDSRTIYFYIY